MVLLADTVNGIAVRQDLFRGWDFNNWTAYGGAAVGGTGTFICSGATGGVQSPIDLESGVEYEIKINWATSPGHENVLVTVGATTVTDNVTGTFWVTPAATAPLDIENYTAGGGGSTAVSQIEVRKYDLETGADTGASTGTSTADTTVIDTQYPATGTGKVEEIEVNLAVNGNSIKVGCGELVGTTFKPRNVVTIDTTGDGTGIKTYTAANSDFAKFGIMRGDFLVAYSSSVTQLALIEPTPKGLGSVSGDQLPSLSERFDNENSVADAGWTLIGSPVIDNGIILEGIDNQYAKISAAGVFGTAYTTIAIKFIPGFPAGDAVNYTLYDATTGARNYIWKTGSSKSLLIVVSNVTIGTITLATYEPYWLEDEENIIVVSGTSGATTVHLNGTLILNSAVAWPSQATTEFFVGSNRIGQNSFLGKVCCLNIYNSQITAGQKQELIDGKPLSFTASISTASSVQMQARGFRLEAGKINGQNLSDLRYKNGALVSVDRSEAGPGYGTNTTNLPTSTYTLVETTTPAAKSIWVDTIEVNVAVDGGTLKVGCGQLVGTTFSPTGYVEMAATKGTGQLVYTAADGDFEAFAMPAGDYIFTLNSDILTRTERSSQGTLEYGYIIGDHMDDANFTITLTTGGRLQFKFSGLVI